MRIGLRMSFVKFEKPKELKEMQKNNHKICRLLDELETLEDGIDCDYTEISTDLAWIKTMLEHRKTTLQNKGRTL